MSIQPGVGYNFTSSSQGTNLDVQKDWVEYVSAAASESTHPFKVSAVSTSTYTVKTGAVNNAIPTNMTSTISVSGLGYIWVAVPYAGSTFDPASLVIAGGTTVPSDTDTYGYIAIATVNAGAVDQLVTGSLWASRIKVGTLTAKYYYARV